MVRNLVLPTILQTEIPELLKFGAFAREVRLYTMRAIKPNGSVPIQADGTQLFCGKVFCLCMEVI